MRELAWQRAMRMWTLAIPLIIIAALEAAYGLLLFFQGAELQHSAHGTYINRNHFAGLLEMALPFAIMYAVAIAREGRAQSRSPALAALRTCLLFAVAALILVGIIYSYSRMGFVACLLPVGRVELRRGLLRRAERVLQRELLPAGRDLRERQVLWGKLDEMRREMLPGGECMLQWPLLRCRGYLHQRHLLQSRGKELRRQMLPVDTNMLRRELLQAGRAVLPDPCKEELAVPVHADEGFSLLPVP